MSTIVYLDEISMDFTVADVLKGTGSIYVANPFSTAPKGVKPFDEKSYFKMNKQVKGAISGVYYNAPDIYIKKIGTDNYIQCPKLCLTANKATKSIFSFKKPYGEEITAKSNMNIGVNFNGAPWTEKIEKIDFRLNIILDVLLSAKLVGIDLKPMLLAKNNDEFFTMFNEQLKANSTIAQKFKNKIIAYQKSYYDCWDDIPVYVKSDDGYKPVSRLAYENDHEQVEEDLDSFVISGVFTKLIEKISMLGFAKANSNFIPMNRRVIYKKNDEDRTFDNTNLKFKIKIAKSNVPDKYISKKLVKKDKKNTFAAFTESNMHEIWGGKSSSSATYEGFIICELKYEINVYKVGSTYLRWIVDYYNGKSSDKNSSSAINEDELPEIADSDDDSDESPEKISSNTANTGDIECDEDDI